MIIWRLSQDRLFKENVIEYTIYISYFLDIFYKNGFYLSSGTTCGGTLFAASLTCLLLIIFVSYFLSFILFCLYIYFWLPLFILLVLFVIYFVSMDSLPLLVVRFVMKKKMERNPGICIRSWMSWCWLIATTGFAKLHLT